MSSLKRTPGPAPERFPHQQALEGLFDRDLSHLQVHTGERSGLDAIGANALAHGNQVAFADSTPTLDIMAHEVAHTVQQGGTNAGAAGARTLTTQLGDPAEREAQAAETKALNGEKIDVAAASTGQLAGDWFTGAAIGAGIGTLLGGPVGTVAGGVIGGMIQDAMSDDEEEAPAAAEEEELTPRQAAERNIREDADLSEAQVEQRLAGYDIQANHDTHGRYYDDPSNTVVDLSNADAREAALNNFSQNHMEHYRGDGEYQNMCGATSLMAAVMAGGGSAGVGDLAQSLMANQGEDMEDFMREEFQGIIERAGSNELTQWDLMTLTDTMHGQMQAFDDAHDQGEVPGVTGAAIEDLVQHNPAITQAMEQGGIGMSSVDTDNDGLGNHWILRMGLGDSDRENNRIYDPMAAVEGSQIRTGSENFERYVNADPSNLPD